MAAADASLLTADIRVSHRQGAISKTEFRLNVRKLGLTEALASKGGTLLEPINATNARTRVLRSDTRCPESV